MRDNDNTKEIRYCSRKVRKMKQDSASNSQGSPKSHSKIRRNSANPSRISTALAKHEGESRGYVANFGADAAV